MRILYLLLLLFTINIVPVHAGLVPVANVEVNVDVPPAKKKKRKKRRKRVKRKHPKKLMSQTKGVVLVTLGGICVALALCCFIAAVILGFGFLMQGAAVALVYIGLLFTFLGVPPLIIGIIFLKNRSVRKESTRGRNEGKATY